MIDVNTTIALLTLLVTGAVAKFWVCAHFAFPSLDLCNACCCRRAECCEAIENGGTDLDFCDLSVECFGHEPLAELFDAIHLGFDPAAAVIPAPFAPERSAKTFGSLQGVVTRFGTVRCGLP